MELLKHWRVEADKSIDQSRVQLTALFEHFNPSTAFMKLLIAALILRFGLPEFKRNPFHQPRLLESPSSLSPSVLSEKSSSDTRN